MSEIAADEKVITTAVTYQRVIYPQFTPVKSLPKELQELVTKDKLVEKYGKVFKPVETNINYKQRYEKADREIASLKDTIEKLSTENASLKKSQAQLEPGAEK